MSNCWPHYRALAERLQAACELIDQGKDFSHLQTTGAIKKQKASRQHNDSQAQKPLLPPQNQPLQHIQQQQHQEQEPQFEQNNININTSSNQDANQTPVQQTPPK